MADFPSFAGELTRLLGVEPPKPATSDGQNNDYRFERPVSFTHTGTSSRGRIDLYRRGCFILEAKQVPTLILRTPTSFPCWTTRRSPRKAMPGAAL